MNGCYYVSPKLIVSRNTYIIKYTDEHKIDTSCGSCGEHDRVWRDEVLIIPSQYTGSEQRHAIQHHAQHRGQRQQHQQRHHAERHQRGGETHAPVGHGRLTYSRHHVQLVKDCGLYCLSHMVQINLHLIELW